MAQEVKQTGNKSELPMEEHAVALLIGAGREITEAGKAPGDKDGTAYSYHSVLMNEGIPILADSKFVRPAQKTILKLANGKTVGDMKETGRATVLGAAQAILDRHEPVV